MLLINIDINYFSPQKKYHVYRFNILLFDSERSERYYVNIFTISFSAVINLIVVKMLRSLYI